MGASCPAVFPSLFNCSELSGGSSSVPLQMTMTLFGKGMFNVFLD